MLDMEAAERGSGWKCVQYGAIIGQPHKKAKPKPNPLPSGLS